jgi:peptidyl-prolyl cis-trans isomerase B (cyclophilin B)
LRQYQARQTVHASKVARRGRDNVIAVVGLVVVAALATTAQLVYFAGPGAPEPTATPTVDPTIAPSLPPAAEAPAPELSEFRTWTGELTLNEEITLDIELDGLAAPQAVASFVSLAQLDFFSGLTCHRLTTTGIFVLQCGDPAGDGSGGPDYRFGPIENAPADNVYPTGTLAMARQGGDGASMGSQFFIVYEESTIPADAAGGYTVLGRITGGLDDLQSRIVEAGAEGGSPDGAPAVPTTITSITIQ